MLKHIAKKTHIFFLLLAAIVFNAHMIIPHDHHQSDSDTCNSGRFPINKTNHHPVFPAHCHAFNDLVAEKAIVISNLQNIQLIDAVISDATIPELSVSGISYIEVHKRPLNLHASEIISLRAPPTLF